MDGAARYERNIPLVFALNGLWMFMVLLPVIVPFFQSRGLSMAGVYSLQAVFGAALLVLEVPSGYASDLFGRKRSLVLASIFHGIGFTLFVRAHGFAELVVGELFLALGLSLHSGTDVSLVYDSLAAAGSKKAPIKLLGRNIFYQQVGETLGGLVGGWLVLSALDAPVRAQAVVAWLPLLPALALREPPRARLLDPRSHRENAAYVWRSLFGRTPLLTLIVLNSIAYGVATLIAVWAVQKYWQVLGIPLSYFGYLWAAANLATALTARYAHKIEKRLGSAATVALMALLPVAGYFGMALTAAAWGALFCIFFQVSRGINAVVLRDALNRRISSDMRATANSVTSLGVRALFVAFGPLVGACLDARGPAPVFHALGWAYVAVFALLAVPLLRQRRNYEPVPA